MVLEGRLAHFCKESSLQVSYGNTFCVLLWRIFKKKYSRFLLPYLGLCKGTYSHCQFLWTPEEFSSSISFSFPTVPFNSTCIWTFLKTGIATKGNPQVMMAIGSLISIAKRCIHKAWHMTSLSSNCNPSNPICYCNLRILRLLIEQVTWSLNWLLSAIQDNIYHL